MILKSAMFVVAVLGLFFGSFAEVVEYKQGVNLTKITNGENTSVLLFAADWCRPCGIMNNNVTAAIGDTLLQKHTVVIIDIDEHEDLYAKYKVQNIPAMLVYKGGKQLESVVGLQNETVIKKLITKHSK